ncbi:hypothetical protein HD600_000472 [Microbacterium ginsengiterrae]|uniref:Uncharacterized protein n=1 Tax=Microbacterium ginsengiterrae TaxID=546115 RepID=A0A7W9CAD6_9MICO|nr:hypothetical protein [Microbacterium ginsengiterrae]MBB5741975.1 hypothetical protein [Microbacterium ginsengiterrae]
MEPLDTLAAVGEVMSWVGLGAGIPLLVITGMIAIAEGRWEAVEIAVVDRAGIATARWFCAGDFHERPLSAREHAAEGWHDGFVSVRDPSHVRLSPPVARRLFATLGAVFIAVGIVGFILSMIPAFL